MKRKLFIPIIVIALLFSPAAAWANINVLQVDNPPTLESKFTTIAYSGDFTTKEIVNVAAYEINNLRIKFKSLDRVNWSVYAINKQCTDITNNNPISGLGGYGEIYLFLYQGITKDYVSNTVTHELGHAVNDEFLRGLSQEYLNLRADGKTHNGYYDTARELFAEDFCYLFGSERAKNAIKYQPTYPKPGDKEKEWILNKLLITWQDRLQYYKTDHTEGEKEIARAGGLYNTRKAKGDLKGAESAHSWANQVRAAVGVPTT